ncbi:Cobalt/zinc/cadmium efflux RND transporter, membrane fusion protein, CzcB family [hydrothermal vent metagenome]|uniref:Cobalt/zinc/cadmium efflux RND transporter, membrane fusion protein, CzcB family n=1 Tax=hydrothermal vent metagenome TaxID=652676 RepID=A0A3B0W3C0_9ZZZZ
MIKPETFKVKQIFLCTALMMGLTGTSVFSVAHAAEDEKEIMYWVAPMDPNYRRDKAGKSPMGMDLIPFYAGEDSDGSTVSISPTVVQNLGVRTAKAELTRLWRGIDTVGYVDYDESKVSHIHLRTTGWVENLTVKSEGERVKKGDRLFDLYSPELVNAQEEFVVALSSGNKGLVRASKERLSALGISKNQINQLKKDKRVKQRISIYASQDGVVSDFPVRDGMYIKPSMKVMTLGDLSSVWLLAEVFERQSQWVEVGQDAEVTLSYIPGKNWQGKVEYIYPSLDPKTRTLKVRLRFDNPGERLKPNMYANVKIYGGAKENTIVIPLEGLIRTGREERVIIALGEGKFEARSVTAGIESGDYVEIMEGVNEGEKIVTSGQFLIDSEASMRASITRMSEPQESESGMSDMSDATESKIVSGSGVVKVVMAEDRKLKLQHEPIKELGWPAMTMDFILADDVDISNLSVDEKVMFVLEERDDRYLITAIHEMKAGGSDNGGM